MANRECWTRIFALASSELAREVDRGPFGVEGREQDQHIMVQGGLEALGAFKAWVGERCESDMTVLSRDDVAAGMEVATKAVAAKSEELIRRPPRFGPREHGIFTDGGRIVLGVIAARLDEAPPWEKEQRAAEAERRNERAQRRAGLDSVAALEAFLDEAEHLACDYPAFVEWRSRLRSRAECVAAVRVPADDATLEQVVSAGTEAQRVLAVLRAEHGAIANALMKEVRGLLASKGDRFAYISNDSDPRLSVIAYRALFWAEKRGPYRLGSRLGQLGSALGLPASTPVLRARQLIVDWLAQYDALDPSVRALLPGVDTQETRDWARAREEVTYWKRALDAVRF